MKEGIGVSVDVEIVDPETLERSVGKIRRIVDLCALRRPVEAIFLPALLRDFSVYLAVVPINEKPRS